ncbi:hypothetical protein OS190_15145 [Sulfitobacter sp. F26204]|uniref:hypothetical protein n=1 Tax=Sulfitobacter sp. F26204 TaxID=2996014 RepID=UPI00225DDDA5|nr:hypothetical protein [Sulfitobacter sp. F26204]MCX7560908.1 hypothetical protein [Sulfitobacter sp. F26204]
MFFRRCFVLLALAVAGDLAAQAGERAEVPKRLWQIEPDLLGAVLLVPTGARGHGLWVGWSGH